MNLPRVTAEPVESSRRSSCEALEWLRRLVSIESVNPPGNEAEAARFVASLLESRGLPARLVEPEPGRVSVVSRLPGTGRLPPILLTGHLDVVSADPSRWKYPPFEGRIEEGCLWGRGVIDCKGITVLALHTFLELAREGVRFDRDVLFAAVADEEVGSRLGAHYLVENHRDLVEAEYVIGELGAISQRVMGKTVFPIQVAERGSMKLMVEIEAPARHTALGGGDSLSRELERFLRRLRRHHHPYRTIPAVSQSLVTLGQSVGGIPGLFLRMLAREVPGFLLASLLPRGPVRSMLDAMTRTTLSVTRIETEGGSAGNATPERIRLFLDGRFLPGTSPDDLVDDLRGVAGGQAQVTLISLSHPVETVADDPLYRTLESTLLDASPGSVVLPSLMPGGTDAKAWVRMGGRYFGFSPLDLARHPGIRLSSMIHGADERLPLDAFFWGLEVHHRALRRFLDPM